MPPAKWKITLPSRVGVLTALPGTAEEPKQAPAPAPKVSDEKRKAFNPLLAAIKAAGLTLAEAIALLQEATG